MSKTAQERKKHKNPRALIPLSTRLAARVDKSGGPDACWEWRGHRTPLGYGRIGDEGSRRVLLTHRVAWEDVNGPVPDGMYICHRCDNPPCCNPSHLFTGTAADNIQDAKQKGRLPCTKRRREAIFSTGKYHDGIEGRSRLSRDQVESIRASVRGGETMTAVAKRFGITQPHVSRIVRGIAWGWTA